MPTQLDIATKEAGWGLLQTYLTELQRNKRKLDDQKELVKALERELYRDLRALEENRRTRVIQLLVGEERMICLCHSLVFPESGVEDWLVPKEKGDVAVIRKSWQVRRGYDDSEKTYTDHSVNYMSTTCANCRSTLSRGVITDTDHNNYCLASQRPDQPVTVESLYTKDVLDKISSEYFSMPVVTAKNILTFL